MSFITAHALDSTVGTPAADLEVTLYSGAEEIVSARTDDNGRVSDFGPDHLEPGDYRIVFGTGDYFEAGRSTTSTPLVTIDFTVQAGQEHYHIPAAEPLRLQHLPRQLSRSDNDIRGSRPPAGSDPQQTAEADRTASGRPRQSNGYGVRKPACRRTGGISR